MLYGSLIMVTSKGKGSDHSIFKSYYNIDYANKTSGIRTSNVKSETLLLVLEALQMEKMVASIRSWMTHSEESASTRPLNSMNDHLKGTENIHILIVEGFLLYNYR